LKTVDLQDWNSLAALADEHRSSTWIFRGVEDENYQLIPRIGRSDTSRDLNTSNDLGYSAEHEDRCIERFKREARPHMIIEPRSRLDWLSIAQHHGVPTRLLDWTDSPLIASYFALREGGFVNKQPKNAAIYGIACPQIVSSDQEIELVADVVAYFPQHLTPRITAQRGLFTYHPIPDHTYTPSELVKWIIPSRICFTLKVILNKCGFNEASMFPDLVGVGRHVGWLLKWRLL
jgi:hypothetical protein